MPADLAFAPPARRVEDMARITGIGDYVESNKPVVYRMDWGMPGEADLKPGVKNAPRFNPGKWQVQELRTGKASTSDLSDRAYIRAATTPIFEEP
jgi:hypothetical protein